MVEGYFDGYRDDRDEFPESMANRSRSYRHGWLNGHDDRTGKPRASAEELRRAADVAMLEDELS